MIQIVVRKRVKKSRREQQSGVGGSRPRNSEEVGAHNTMIRVQKGLGCYPRAQ